MHRSCIVAVLTCISSHSAAEEVTLKCMYRQVDFISDQRNQGEAHITLDLDTKKYMYANLMEINDIKIITEDKIILNNMVDGEEIVSVTIDRNTAEYSDLLKLDGIHLMSKGRCVRSELIPFPAQARAGKLL